MALDIGPEPYLIDISLPLETQEALLVDGAVITETTGVVPEAGFDAELTADLTEEPFGGVIVPDPEQPLVWEYQPAGPGPDLLEYTLSDAEGGVVATITLEFTVAEAAEEEPVDEPDPETSEEEPADEPEADESPADDPAAEEASDPDAGEGDEAAEPAPETDGDEPVEETTDDPPPADQAAEGSTAATTAWATSSGSPSPGGLLLTRSPKATWCASRTRAV